MRALVLCIASALLGTAAAWAQTGSLQEMKPEAVVALGGDTHHVQGLLVSGNRLFLTSVDNAARKAYLFEHDLKTGARLRAIEIQQGTRYHPGGFDGDDGSLWIPVAEYRPGSTTVVQRRSMQSLELISSFEVADHVGALAVGPDRLYAANWDARKLIELSRDGKILRSRENPTPLAIQDWKYRYGLLVASAAPPAGTKAGSVAWIDPERLQVRKTVASGVTDRGIPFTNEGLDSRDGTLYVLPEDAPSRLFVFNNLQPPD
jgi:hypothetical protein